MKDASTARLTAGQLRKGPPTAFAEMDITGQMLTLSTCHAPVCGLWATGEGGTQLGKETSVKAQRSLSQWDFGGDFLPATV